MREGSHAQGTSPATQQPRRCTQGLPFKTFSLPFEQLPAAVDSKQTKVSPPATITEDRLISAFRFSHTRRSP